MRITSTDKTNNRKRKRAMYLAASALAVTASLAGAGALADHKNYGHHDRGYDRYDRGYEHHNRSCRQDHYRYGPTYWNHQQKVRVKIPVRDHGPETLPIGRLIMQNSDIDLDRYRLVAVVTKNGRFSNGYASLRTGNSKSHRYFLGAREKTRIPAPSHADRKWRRRLGPGTHVRSVTAVLEPRHGWSYRQPTHRRHASSHDHRYESIQGAPWLGLAWMIANAEDDKKERKQARRLGKLRSEQARTEAELAETQRKLDRSRERNKRLKDQRARLAEELAHERVETRPRKRDNGEGHRSGSRRGERVIESDVKRTVRYVTSAS
ncbi:MAG: hypothetical protein EP301_00825 [Gammaproteobacteria bacterium]|nr:MAG: hypothetical protein EP301_00825 [Gammaproteobacteria bacterium]